MAEYVGDHTGDMVSTVLLLTQFRAGGHEAEADSLFDLIDHEARPGYLCDAVRGAINERLRYDLSTPVVPFDMFTSADTLMSFNPRGAAVSMLVFTSRESERDREFVGAVGDIYRKYKGEPEVVSRRHIAVDRHCCLACFGGRRQRALGAGMGSGRSSRSRRIVAAHTSHPLLCGRRFGRNSDISGPLDGRSGGSRGLR